MSYSGTAARRRVTGLGALLAMALGAQAEAATVRFEPLIASVNPGDAFSLTLMGEDFVDVLDGGGLDFSFDPTIVQVTGVNVDTTVWDFSASNGVIDNGSGSVTDILFSALQNVSGAFSIATVQFQALGTGTSGLALAESALNPFASGGDPLPVSFGDGTVNVVPVPATLWLFASAFGGLARFTGQGRKS